MWGRVGVAYSVYFSQPCVCCAASTWLTVCPRICPPGRWVRPGKGGKQVVHCFWASSFCVTEKGHIAHKCHALQCLASPTQSM